MSIPPAPLLNGRRIAEFYCATEVAKRTVLRAYAKPPEEQEARVILYDPIRKAAVAVHAELVRRGKRERTI
jgi:hypothetical protein